MTILLLTMQQPALKPLLRHLGDDLIVCTKGHSERSAVNVPETFFYEGPHRPSGSGTASAFDVEMVAGCLARLYRVDTALVDAYAARIFDNVAAFLDANPVDTILFRTGPHIPHEMAFHLLARKRRIKLGLFEETSFFDRAFLFPSMEQKRLPHALWSLDRPFELNASQREAIVDVTKLKEHYYGIFKTKRNSLADVTRAAARSTASVIKANLRGTPLSGTAFGGENPLRPSIAGALSYWKANIAGTLQAERAYFAKVESPEIYARLDERTVIFYGNYAPERTVFPDSYPYHDFLPALARLQHYEKRIWREHPTQFSMPGKPYMLRGGFYKGAPFYEEVRRRGWMLGPLNFPTEAIVRSPAMIATLNGTVALEAALKKRKLILFANNWYRDLPNVTGPEEGDADLDYDVLDVVGGAFARTFPRINFQSMEKADLDATALALDLVSACPAIQDEIAGAAR